MKRAIILAAVLCLAGGPADAAVRTWTSQRAGTTGHQWSANSSSDTSSPWYDGGTQSGYNGYPGDSPGTNLDVVTLKHAVTQDVSVTLGLSLQGCPVVIATEANTGTPTTFLAAGTYKGYYTVVSAKGETAYSRASTVIEFSFTVTTRGTDKPRITFPAAPPASCTYNLYLTQAAGASGTERLYCTGISGTTVDLQGADNGSGDSFWNNTYSAGVASGGSTAFASATAVSGLTFAAKAALTIQNSGVLTVGSSNTLTLRGDYYDNAPSADIGIVVSAGGAIQWDPTQATDPTTAAYLYYSTQSSIQLNGTSGSPCSVSTLRTLGTEARAVCITNSNSARFGYRGATYTNFTDLGGTVTGTAFWGLQGIDNVTSSTTAFTFTNCTFTRTNFNWSSNKTTYDGNITFQYNNFVSSITTSFGGKTICALFSPSSNPTSGTRLIDSCAFDKMIYFASDYQFQKTNNIFQHAWTAITGSNWTSDSYCNGNIFYFGATTDLAGSGIIFYGPWKNCYFYDFDSTQTNPHFSSIAGVTGITAYSVTGCLYEGSEASDSTGASIFATSTGFPASSQITVRGNIILPLRGTGTYAGQSPGYIGPTDFQGTVTIISDHNTTFCMNETSSGFYWGETTTPAANSVLSARANLIANYAGSTRAYAVAALTHTTTDVIQVPNGTTAFGAGHNGFYNPTTGSCTCNGSATASVGYNAFAVTSSGFPNAQIGTGDVYGSTAAYDPMFVDKTRCLGSWGQVVHGVSAGSDNGTSETITWLVSTGGPVNLSTNIAAMETWVRSGYRPTNTVYRAASYSGDTYTDPNGNTASGATADIGAMAWTASAGGAALLPSARRAPRRSPPPVVIRLRPFDRIYRRAG